MWIAYFSPNSPIFPALKFSHVQYTGVIIIVVFIYSVVLLVVVYSNSAIVSGDEIAALINQNKETFSLAVSDAVVGKSPA